MEVGREIGRGEGEEVKVSGREDGMSWVGVEGSVVGKGDGRQKGS